MVTASSRRLLALSMIISGVVMAVGGAMHPDGAGDEADEFLASMLESSTWDVSHILIFLGVAGGAATFVFARQINAFGSGARRMVTVAIVGWTIAAAELIPHLLASQDLDELRADGSTPILDLHLLLQVVATPALGITGAALAIAVAQSAGTKPAWVLATIATLGGVAYTFAGPLFALTESIGVTALFPAQVALAIWLLGTGIRLARPDPTADSQPDHSTTPA